MIFPAPLPPSTPARVVITSAGIVTALGLGWKTNAEGFRSGRQAFHPVTLFDVSQQRTKRAAEADLPEGLPKTRLNKRQVSRLDRACTLLLWAAHEAWEQSGWDRSGSVPLVLGTTSGGMSLGESYFRQAIQTPDRHRQQPTRAFHYQAQSQARLVLDSLGLDGPITVISNACASGGCAIGHAWELIRRGHVERVLAGGYDAINQLVFSGFDALQALSPTTCRPFDAARDGLGLGEGAAMMTLESLDSARRRDALILGEVIGYGTTIDQHSLTQPHPEGEAAMGAMTLACNSARLTPRDIDYVNAHGTGTPLNDSAEAIAIHRWAGDHVASVPVSSVKCGIGHLLGGSGAVEAVACLMVLQEQWLPPEIGFENPDPVCKSPIVHRPQDARVNVVLSNSFGFGGVNATLILRRWA